MKKILLFTVLSLFVFAACKKQQDNPSTVITASYPKITFAQKYYSIPLGTVRPEVQATAYDSFYKETVRIITFDSTINNFVPGVYMATLLAQSSHGYATLDTYYVAVTNVANTMDLSGNWNQVPVNDSTSTTIVKLANGLYSSNNVNGVNLYTDPTNVVYDLFAVTTNTTIVFLSGNTATLTYNASPLVSTMSYTTPSGIVTFKR